jgi:transcriptional regulator with XRE-family HTH domain
MTITVHGFAATIERLDSTALAALASHRLAAMFPKLVGDDKKRLNESLQRGYDDTHPVIAWAKTRQIVDGRNRAAIAAELNIGNVPVAFVDFADEEQIAAYVVSSNLARRHLTKEQRDAVIKKMAGEGVKTKEIAKATGVTPQRVGQITTKERAAAKAVKAEKVSEAVAAGKSQREIAKELGVTKSAVVRVVQNENSFQNGPADKDDAVPHVPLRKPVLSMPATPEKTPVPSTGAAADIVRAIPDEELRRNFLHAMVRLQRLPLDIAATVKTAVDLLNASGDTKMPVDIHLKRVMTSLDQVNEK